MRHIAKLSRLSVATLLLLAGAVKAQLLTSTNSISLQAKLEGITAPSVNLTVKFYDALTGGMQKGSTISLSNVPVSNGIVSVPVSPADASIFNGATRYMEIAVNGNPLLPRTLVTSVPYAMMASNLDSFNIAVASSPSTGYSAYSVRTYNDPQVYAESIPDWAGTGVPAKFYRAVGSPWERALGMGFAVGDQIASTVVWAYKSWSRSAFQVRGVGYNEGVFGPSSETWMTVRDTGVGIFTETPQAALDVNGTTRTRVLQITGGSDLVEGFDSAIEDIEPGTLMVIDPEHPGQLKPSTTAYDSKVAGIVSGANGVIPGIKMGQNGKMDGELPIAMTGRVYVKCTVAGGKIQPGDLLTTSDLPGHAMKASDRTLASGATIGKAMSALDESTGLVLVLVNLQ